MTRMATPVIDLQTLRKGCAHCSLQQLCLPAGIGMEGLQQLDSIVRRRRPIARGESLFRTGDALAAVYVARDGAFKTVTLSEDGDEQVLGFHLPGELIGLDALGGGSHRPTPPLRSDANVCEVPFDQLADVASQVPGLQHQLLRVIGRSVGRDQDHLDMLARRQASERIAHAEQGLPARDGPTAAHDRIQLPQAVHADARGEAQLLQRAVRATAAQGREIEDGRGHGGIVAGGLPHGPTRVANARIA